MEETYAKIKARKKETKKERLREKENRNKKVIKNESEKRKKREYKVCERGLCDKGSISATFSINFFLSRFMLFGMVYSIEHKA